MNKTKISLISLILMIFTTIYGFGNTTVAFDQMGYASIPWYIFAAIIFFLPSGLMFAEYGASLKDSHGGIYSWLSNSIGEKYAFVGTFIWLSSWIIWMVSTSSKVWIPLSTMIFGHDTTQSWNFMGFNSMQVVGILAFLWIIVITYFSSKGVKSITKISSIGGTFVMILTGIFLSASIIILIANHGELQQPVNGLQSFTQSPNPLFSSPIAIMSFVVYAIFAYAGMESMGGIVDSLDKPEKTFPRGIITATLTITIFYSLCIFLWGISTNWTNILGKNNVNLGNITYVLMDNLGLVFGKSLGLSHATSALIGTSLARFTGLSMFLGYLGSFFILTYSPLKSFIIGTPKEFWPKKMTKLNEAGMPAYAMWIQAAIVGIIVLLISFGGSGANQFYLILTDMGNISTTVPYIFLIGAFPFFKARKDLDRPFVAFKNKTVTNVIVTIMMIIICLGILFTAIQPILDHDYVTAFWTIIGPIFFGGIGLAFYKFSKKRLTSK
ncbi:glutamate/gamma-aminobutyrate family transporter YjeM [Lentilactobacillus laojiaonis]|uniref:glutamate/gamma-aminobutyrate family transporter YjeM n=1 Tax=Lentilactobacillus laojiaonis TaxID=2883998 RepID=UPI001D0A09E7|nr:glutamate/gamma-aminobutyrate family transporter YjeM [Lentilactobacillus laojiaonis]UDM31583.1 glutamate/gamma-aminobutyrate family transporter YjeM [Lentilactobacillus laojiaonis]